MSNFFKDKRVLVTGASGFIGRNLTRALYDAGSRVTVLVSHQEDLKKSPLVNLTGIHSIVGNITDTEFVLKSFENHRFDLCFHLAGQALVEVGSVNPVRTFEVNMQGTWNILEAARQTKLSGIVVASTAHVYGNNKLPFLEKYFPRPSRPYETSKACADMIAQTYVDFYDLPLAIARFVNIYGPGDENMRIVPNTVRALEAGKAPEVFSDRTTRDYMYIEDAVTAYLSLAEHLNKLRKKRYNIIFNFGTGQHYSNAEVIEKIISLYGSTIKPKVTESRVGQEIQQQYVSIAKAKRYLGWNPRFSLEEGLKKTIEWYKENTKI